MSGDAADVQRLAGAFEVADTTLNIPHPYPDGAAAAWIATHDAASASNQRLTLAIAADDQLVGAISLHLGAEHHRAELGYWVGVPYWRRGYASEAATAVIAHGFTVMRLHRIFAHHLVRNPASGRVMQKAGMTFEGCLRGHVFRSGAFEDLAIYGIINS